MPRYLVNSYSRDDGGQFLGDFVEAENADAAVDIVRRARPYAIVDDAVQTAKDLREVAERLESCPDIPTTALKLAQDLDDAGHLCRECGADNSDGEEWDGLCGACADKAEKAGVYDA